MALENELPGPVVAMLKKTLHSEFATLSSAGVPIDTPMLYWPNEALSIFHVATGLAYPSKAERARKHPKTSVTLEGSPNEPVVVIAGMAAVRDSNLQANSLRYIAETGFARVGPAPWELAHKAVWYWTRMIIEITPAKIYWWDTPAAMDGPPHEWRAPADQVYPASDPAPAGSVSAAPKWAQPPWQEQAQGALGRAAPGHLALCDADGFPLSIRARAIKQSGEGFHLDMPRGCPWPPSGKATLTFEGRATFVGEVSAHGNDTFLKVERALPIHPFVAVPAELWEPSPDNYEKMMGRLRHETARRNQPIPTIPAIEPEPTAGARFRMASVAATPNLHGFSEDLK